MKRTLAILLLLMLVITCCSARLPNPIFPLDYESMPEPADGVHHYLMACFDTWDYQKNYPGNTDGILLVTLDTNQKRVIFTTVMREILVQRPDGKTGRITYIAKNYGPEALCRIVSTHFGVKVEKYIFFSMDNIQNLIDELGGVHITVTDAEARYLNNYRISRESTTPSMDTGGTYLFTGHAAVIYMRIRKVGGDGDLGRTRRMRTVMNTLVQENQDITLAEVGNVVASLEDNVCLTNLTMNDLMNAIEYSFQLKGVDAEGFQLPVTGALDPINYAGMSTNQVDFPLCRDEFLAFLTHKPQ
jgi:LCP family protein required for cell wall assembly